VFQDGSVEAFFARSPSGPSGQPPVRHLIFRHRGRGRLREISWSFDLIVHFTWEKAAEFLLLRRRPYEVPDSAKVDSYYILPKEIISLLPLFFSTISSLLTLFSKFFSSFLRSTCLLSVSHTYLALEEVYLPFRAAVPNNPTLGALRYSCLSPNTGFLPSMTPFFKELMRQTCLP
jgi:hypothetical protein